MKIVFSLLLLFASLFAYKIENSDGNTIFFIGGNDNNRVSINCGENIDEDYALKVCGKILADDFVKDTITLDFKDSDDTLEGNETDGDNTITFTMVLNKAHTEDIKFHFETKEVSGEATDGDDYVGVDSDFTIPAGDTEKDIEITIKGDVNAEDDEYFDIEITKVTTNFDLIDSSGRYTILNDDQGPIIEMTNPNDTESEDEGDVMSFDIKADKNVVGDTVVKYKIVHKSTDGTNDADFSSLTGDVTIADGTSTATISITANDDSYYGISVENFYVELTDADNGANIKTTDYTEDGEVKNNDSKPDINIDDVSENEDNNHTFTIKLSEKAETDVSFKAKTSDGTAIAGDDYDANETDFTITEADNTDIASFTVTITDNSVNEDDETFNVKVSDIVNGNGVDVDGIGTIKNDDAPKLSIDDVEVDEDAGTATFTITIDLETDIDVTADIDMRHDTTDDDDVDPDEGDTNSITITSSDNKETTFDVTINDDSTDEDDSEYYYLDLSNPTNATIDDGTGKGTINDNDSSGFMSSDRRLKTDIRNIKTSLQDIEKLNGVKFYWKNKKRFGEQEEVGVIAQDVEKVYPQLVLTGKDGYKKVNYQFLVAPLIEAVKELKKENEALTKRIKALEDEK